MKTTFGAAISLGIVLTATGCVVSAGSSSGGASGAAGSGVTAGGGGSAGSSMGVGGSSAGAAGCVPVATGPDCGPITRDGVCACGNVLQLCLSTPVAQGDAAPTLVTASCGAGATCAIDANGAAACVQNTVCTAGDARCAPDGSLETCRGDGSGWDASACDTGLQCTGVPGVKASCHVVPAGAASSPNTLSGNIMHEWRTISKSGIAPAVQVDPAFLNYVAVYEGSQYLGMAITDADGNFTASLSAAPTANATVFVFVMDFDAVTGQPLVAVVRNAKDEAATSPYTSHAYWYWSNKDANCFTPVAVAPNGAGPGKHTVPSFTIPEKCGSGAIRAFQWARFGMLRLDPAQGLAATKGVHQQSLAVVWEPGIESGFCSGCFANKQFGGLHVSPPGAASPDVFDTFIAIAGTNDSPMHWSWSIISHELGHWTMQNYSKPPGEAAQHTVTKKEPPGMAWSEGWATAFGQWNVSLNGQWDPLYLAQQHGTTWWFDISAVTVNDTSGIPLCDPSGPIDQQLGEADVAALVWHLWLPPQSAPGPFQGVGEEAVFRAFQNGRIKSENRGYKTVDLVDFLDATVCAKSATSTQIGAASGQVGFPWDGTPLCP